MSTKRLQSNLVVFNMEYEPRIFLVQSRLKVCSTRMAVFKWIKAQGGNKEAEDHAGGGSAGLLLSTSGVGSVCFLSFLSPGFIHLFNVFPLLLLLRVLVLGFHF